MRKLNPLLSPCKDAVGDLKYRRVYTTQYKGNPNKCRVKFYGAVVPGAQQQLFDLNFRWELIMRGWRQITISHHRSPGVYGSVASITIRAIYLHELV